MRVLIGMIAVAVALVAAAGAGVAGAGVAGAAQPADRQWQTGTWRAPAATTKPVAPVRGARVYAIDGDGVRLEVEEVVSLGGRPLAVTLGTPVKYVVEKFIVHIRDGRGTERMMRLVSSTPAAPAQTSGDKPTPGYPGMGGGHFVKAVRDEGRFVTLEDNSVWEIEPTGRYLTAQWEVQAGISIRSTSGDDGYIYEIDNVDKDEGAAARWVRP